MMMSPYQPPPPPTSPPKLDILSVDPMTIAQQAPAKFGHSIYPRD
jgi:hypothetical protein